MSVDVIGSGALGMVFGARLSQSGIKVRMRTRTAEQAELLSLAGIQYTDLLHNKSVIPVTSMSGSSIRSAGDCDWILLAVKQTALDESVYFLINQIATPHTPVVCLQNGIGHLEKLRARLPEIPFLAAVCTEGALRSGPNSVVYTGKGSLWIEALSDHWTESVQRVNRWNDMISSLRVANIDVLVSDDIQAVVLRKLLVNAIINPLTAIYDVNNGQLPSQPQRLQLMKALFDETRDILETTHGKALGNHLWDYVLEVCAATALNESSMLADVRAQRETEVKWINGGVIELAARLNILAPLNQAMVTLIERLTETVHNR